MPRFYACLLCLVFFSGTTPFAIAQEESEEKPVMADIHQRPASDFPMLDFQRWSGKINVPDPVALSVDNRGHVYVTQTRRRKVQDLDIRSNPDWVPNDVGMQSVEQKREFFRQQLAVDGTDPKQRERVDDWNKDGKHDWRDLTVISEAIYRVVDTDGNGTADQITTFAEGFNTEVTGIAAGVMAFDGDVYSTVAPDVWKLHDHNDDGVADSREVIATGFGLHIAYGGHDMHGLTIGPDGKVYWSIGDKGINVKTADGKHFAYPNQGGVMRCNPDGSDFEVFAHGLRNVQEFAFDQYGNIFGVDNDSDQPGEHERFVAIVDGMDAGWRCNYQYRGDDFNPWTAEKLWETAGEDHPAYIVPPIRLYVDGPAGFKFNPGTALSPEYRDFFFMTNAPAGFQYAFRVIPDGDSFKMVDSHQFGSGDAIVGLAFGPDGGLYGADWDGGYPLDEKGSVIRMDVPASEFSTQHKTLRAEVQTLLHDGFEKRSVDELKGLLAHADQRVRLGAQFALVDQKQTQVFASVLQDANADQLARLHCIWGLGQLARQHDSDAVAPISSVLNDEDNHVVAQAAKTLGEVDWNDAGKLAGLLAHDNLHVRVNAGLALGRHPDSSAVEKMLTQCDSLENNQHYLRHSLVRALAASATPEILVAQSSHQSLLRRMVCVLALRQQSSPLVAEYLADESAWIATEAARAIHDDNSIPQVLPALAASLTSIQHASESFVRRAINANFRMGTTAASERLLDYLTNPQQPSKLLVSACEAIGDWDSPPMLDRVEGRYRDLSQNEREPLADATQAVLTSLVAQAQTSVRVAAVIAARKQHVSLGSEALLTILDSKQVPVELRIQALNSITEDAGTGTADLLIKYARGGNSALAVHAIELLAQQRPETAFSVLKGLLADWENLRIQQAAIAGLTALSSAEADHELAAFGTKVFLQDGTPALMLDIAIAATTRAESSRELSRLQKTINEQQAERSEKLKLGTAPNASKFAFSIAGGDRDRGQRIFETHLQAQCSRCHRIGKSGSNIGPELTKIAKKNDSEYLLRSIVHPSGDIEPKYFTQALLLDSGKIVRGVIQSENDDETILISSDGKEVSIPTDEIEDVSSQKVSLMPDMTDTLSASEVRDLVAYLSTLK
ncbi:MAG: hypothetical protein WBD20_22280 [Pirellulaceae bacterium]